MKHLKKETILGLILAVLVLAVYWNLMHNDFILYDDPDFVTRNDFTQAGLSIEGIRWALTAVNAANWTPITTLSHMLDCQIYGLNPAGHHLTNLFLHLANVLLLFLLLRETTGCLWRSAVVSALFAVHPLHVESVAWISERRDVLSVFWGLMAMIAYCRYAGTRNRASYIASILLFAFSLMSKPMLVTMPFILILLDYWPLGRLRPDDSRNSKQERSDSDSARSPRMIIMEKIPFFIFSGLFCVITVIVQQGAMSSLHNLSPGTRLLNAVSSYGSYLGKLFYPVGLAIFYPYPGSLTFSLQTIFSLFILALISLMAIGSVKRRAYLAMGWFWFLGALVPVIGLIQVGAQSMADRYVYFPAVGIYILSVWGAEELFRAVPWRRKVYALTAVFAICGLSWITWDQVSHWRNTQTLFRHTLSVTENNWLAHNILGLSLSEERNNAAAEAEYRKALKIFPSYPAAHSNLGTLLLNTGKKDEALSHFQRALAENPEYFPSLIGLGESLIALGKKDAALPHLLQARKYLPDNSWSHDLLGLSFSKIGQYEAALTEIRRALFLAPHRFDLYGHMGGILVLQEKPAEAIPVLLTAIQLRPTYTNAYNNMGIALTQIGQLEQSIYFFAAALYLNPHYRDAKDNFDRTVASLYKRQTR